MNGLPADASVAGRKPVLVTGGAGFIGCNLADRLAREGHDVLIFDALARDGVERNLDWLQRTHPEKISFVQGDVRDGAALSDAVKDASAVFHLAAQVAVTTSLVDPIADFGINVMGTIGLLEAARAQATPPPVIFASTNKVYGDLADLPLELRGEAYVPVDAGARANGVGEDRPLDFHTPYGCSKGAADQYVLDWARSFGLNTAVLRMSCIYGPHQMGTEDQGWVAHFVIKALQGEPITLYGDGRQVRDILEVHDCVEAYMQVWRRMETVKGRAFNLGGGPANAVSLRQLLDFIGDLIGRKVDVRYEDWRAGDQRYFVADTRRAHRELGLRNVAAWREGVTRLAHWLDEARGLNALREPARAGAA